MSKKLYVPKIFSGSGLADPHALVDNDKIYIICGHDKGYEPTDTWVMDKWIILESDNLKDWEKVGEISPKDTYIGDEPNCWAGNIKKINNKYYWFFSNKNYNTGVAVSDNAKGKYKDLLGKPLIDKNDISDSKPYDPTVYIENDNYYIIVGAGKYYIAQLNHDLKGLSEKPKYIEIYDDNNNLVRTGDKSSLFKRNNLYYLVWGGSYAISKNLYGPYKYLGEYNPGCNEHNDFFVWKDKWYMVSEHPEISHFYRGIELVEIEFDSNGKLKNPHIHRLDMKDWVFDNNNLGFHSVKGMTLNWCQNGYLEGNVYEKGAMLESSTWPGLTCTKVKNLEITMQNKSSATECEIYISVHPMSSNAWIHDPNVDWSEFSPIKIKINPNDDTLTKYTTSLDLGDTRLKRLAIKPISNASSGRVIIKEIKMF